MALIKCPECGKEVSDKSVTCIGCGFPIQNYILKIENERKAREKREAEALILEQQKIEDEKKWECLPDKRGVLIQKKSTLIEINGMDLKIRLSGHPTITDKIWNFSLEYFGVSLGYNIGFMINNLSKQYSTGVVDIVDAGEVKKQLVTFKEIMENNGLYTGRSRFDVLYKQTGEEKEIHAKHYDEIRKAMNGSSNVENDSEFNGIYRYILGRKERVYCPRCHSSKCSYFTTESVIPGKTKTKYTANLNPLKPFTLMNKKEKVVRKERTVTENKIICNECGNIF